MSLKFKRNLPLILFLVTFLSFLAFGVGDQRVISYTITVEPSNTTQATTIGSDTNSDRIDVFGLTAAQDSGAVAQNNDVNETPSIVSELTNNQ